MMKLDDTQRKKVAEWIGEGLKLSDIQKRISSEFGLSLTYMDVRFLVDDLKLTPKDPTPPPAPVLPPTPAKPAHGPSPLSGSGPRGGLGGGPGLPSIPTLPPIPGQPAKPPGALPALSPLPEGEAAGFAGSVTVGVDTVARPGAMVSGSVVFSDGQKCAWYLDQFGRLGVAPEKPGYKPTPADVETFQMELEKQLSRFGF